MKKIKKMEFKKVKQILEILLIKKYNFNVDNEELVLLNELQVLLSLATNLKSDKSKKECSCELNEKTIDYEIENNQCFDCGFPISVL